MKIIKVPSINALGKTGPEDAPNLIIKELKKKYSGFEKLNIENVCVDNGDIEEAEKKIYKKAVESIFNGKVVFVGGDHSISYPILKAFSGVYKNNFLIVFDAHADCMKPMKEPTHEEWLRGIVESGWNPKNIVLIGVRKIEDAEEKFLEEKGVKVFLSECNLEEIANYVIKNASGKNVYVSVDVDVLDFEFAPGVNYPEGFGLSEKNFFYLLKKFFFIDGVRGMDIVEVVPKKDKKLKTIKIAGKIIKSFLDINK